MDLGGGGTTLARRDHNLKKALMWARRAQAATLPATPIGAGDAVGDVSSFAIRAATAGAVAVTVDTLYALPDTRGAGLDGKWIAMDRAAPAIRSGNTAGTLRAAGGVLTIASQFFGGSGGDAALATAVPSYSVSPGNTLRVTFTPPAGYVGTIEWYFALNATED